MFRGPQSPFPFAESHQRNRYFIFTVHVGTWVLGYERCALVILRASCSFSLKPDEVVSRSGQNVYLELFRSTTRVTKQWSTDAQRAIVIL